MAAVKDALDPSWINAPGGVGPSYDAEELRRLQGYQLAGGATPGTSRTGVLNPRDLALSLSGSNVLVGAGGAVIGTAKGAYVCGVAATTTIGALLAADVTNPRRDRVVLRILDPDNGGLAGRKAQLEIIDGTPNASAATGGGYPAEPPLSITLGYVDVPKVGSGSPSITITAPLTAAAGAPIPVRSQAERDALPKWDGLQALRLDLPGRPVESCDGAAWSVMAEAAPLNVTGWTCTGMATVVPEGGKKRVTVDIEVKRTGSAMTIGTAGWTVIGAVIPTIARGGTSPVKYLACAVVGGANNFTANVAVNAAGTVSIRGTESFSFTTNALITINVVYYI